MLSLLANPVAGHFLSAELGFLEFERVDYGRHAMRQHYYPRDNNDGYGI